MTAVPSSRRPMMPLARAYAEQAFSRAAGAQLVEGNVLRVLRDARENFPAWLEAIESARERIHLECYIISNDRVGAAFADALIRKVREGVQVRLLYDWVGSLGESGHRYYQRLKDAGVEVRCFNPPRIDDPFGVLSRDHRKMLSVDGRIGFVMGLCLSAKWEGNEAKSIAPWRDTGVSLEGPAVDDLDEAFAEVWAATGDPLPPSALTPAEWTSEPGDVAVRVVGTVPTVSGLYRLDLVISALARRTLWLTDAYFVGVPAYVSALSSAARDGVDVRLLVPGASDVPVVSPLSRSGYRPLLESGVRVFEWNGTMLHAKTAVVDGRWARVGSTNLNIQSWLGNYELDVAIENDDIAHELAMLLSTVRRPAVTLTVGALDVFGGDKPRALVARIEQTSALVEMQAEQERLVRRVGLPPDKRKFSPHVTLARLRDTSPWHAADFLSQRGHFLRRSFKADRFVIFSSRASVGGGPYVVEAAYPLAS